MKNILFILGTRPDAIKCAPLILTLKDQANLFNVKVCSTGQHKKMLEQVFCEFDIVPDFNLKIMKNNQALIYTISRSVAKIQETVLKKFYPDMIIVQGDANPAVAGAMAGFYNKIPVSHVEAGLRSGDKQAPFPEEANRIIVSHLATFHFAPTRKCKKNLIAENIKNNVYVVGNTIVDALLFMKKKILKENYKPLKLKKINTKKRIILITGHRRESFGEPFRLLLNSIKAMAIEYPDIEFVYPVHLNPNVKIPAQNALQGFENIHLLTPLRYRDMVWLMLNSYLIISDSGGIQEEAPSLGKPILVTREITERVEGIEAGAALLVGFSQDKIQRAVRNLLNDAKLYKKMSNVKNPYGQGNTSQKIKKILQNKFK